MASAVFCVVHGVAIDLNRAPSYRHITMISGAAATFVVMLDDCEEGAASTECSAAAAACSSSAPPPPLQLLDLGLNVVV